MISHKKSSILLKILSLTEFSLLRILSHQLMIRLRQGPLIPLRLQQNLREGTYWMRSILHSKPSTHPCQSNKERISCPQSPLISYSLVCYPTHLFFGLAYARHRKAGPKEMLRNLTSNSHSLVCYPHLRAVLSHRERRAPFFPSIFSFIFTLQCSQNYLNEQRRNGLWL